MYKATAYTYQSDGTVTIESQTFRAKSLRAAKRRASILFPYFPSNRHKWKRCTIDGQPSDEHVKMSTTTKGSHLRLIPIKR